MSLFLILLTCLTSLVNTISRLINAAMGTHIGSLESSFVNHVVGTLFAGLLLLVGVKTGHLVFSGIPFYYFLGGCLGLLMLAGHNYAVPHVGIMLVLIIFITSQLFTSGLIEHFGLMGSTEIPFSWLRLLGFCLLIGGARLVYVRES